MLCLGVIPPDNVSLESTPSLDTSFIHGTVFRLPGGAVVNTSVWNWPDFLDPIPRREVKPPVLHISKRYELTVRGRYCERPIEILNLGSIGDTSLQGLPLRDWFSLHSAYTLFCTPVRQCIFITMGQPCRFCTFEHGRINRLSVPNFKMGLECVRSAHPSIHSVAIGGGTPNLQDMGAKYFATLVAAASAFGITTSVELVPPTSEHDLRALADAGVASIIMSLEVWGEAERAAWCLGKGRIARVRYIDAWKHAVRCLGLGRVSSVLLVGSEPAAQTIEGARTMISLGVLPILLPLRWYPDSRFCNWEPVAPISYIELEQAVSSMMKAAGLSAAQQPGCIACGGCSLETHFEGESKIA